MEDRDKSKAHGAAGNAESIVELTPDMELSEERDIKIIDLTDAIDGPVESPVISRPAATVSITGHGFPFSRQFTKSVFISVN